MSWKVVIRTYSCPLGHWSSNGKRYASKEAAEEAARSLFAVWTAVEEWKVVPSEDPPNT